MKLMNMALLSLIVLTVLSCKVRDVQKTTTHSKVDSSRVVHTDSTGTRNAVHIDTSTKQVTILTHATDSSVTTTTLTPVPGTTTTIDRDGKVTGQFQHIDRKTAKHVERTHKVVSTSKSGVKDSSSQASHKLTVDSGRKITTKDSSNKATHSNSTVSANFPIKWVLIILAAIVAIGLLIWKFRKFLGI